MQQTLAEASHHGWPQSATQHTPTMLRLTKAGFHFTFLFYRKRISAAHCLCHEWTLKKKPPFPVTNVKSNNNLLPWQWSCFGSNPIVMPNLGLFCSLMEGPHYVLQVNAILNGIHVNILHAQTIACTTNIYPFRLESYDTQSKTNAVSIKRLRACTTDLKQFCSKMEHKAIKHCELLLQAKKADRNLLGHVAGLVGLDS